MSALRQGLKHFSARHGGLSVYRNLGRLVALEQDYLPMASIRLSRYLAGMPHGNHPGDRMLANSKPLAQVNLEQRRFKKKRVSKQDEEEEDDDDDDLADENPLLTEDILGETSDGSERMTIDIGSLRLDTFCKSAFAMTRAKVEEAFYKGDIYVNGKLASKKSQDLYLNDEIDIVKSIDTEDSKLINIRKAIITKLPDKMSEHGRMKLDIQRWQNLTVESKGLRGGGQE